MLLERRIYHTEKALPLLQREAFEDGDRPGLSWTDGRCAIHLKTDSAALRAVRDTLLSNGPCPPFNGSIEIGRAHV